MDEGRAAQSIIRRKRAFQLLIGIECRAEQSWGRVGICCCVVQGLCYFFSFAELLARQLGYEEATEASPGHVAQRLCGF